MEGPILFRQLRELRDLTYYIMGRTSDTVHGEGTVSFLEYAFTATTTQLKSRSVGENMIPIPHSFRRQ